MRCGVREGADCGSDAPQRCWRASKLGGMLKKRPVAAALPVAREMDRYPDRVLVADSLEDMGL